MGDYVQIIADIEATETEAPGLGASVVRWLAGEGIIGAEPTGCVLGTQPGYPPGPRYTVAVIRPEEWLPQLQVNGLAVVTTRAAFHPGQGDPGPVVCPGCGEAELQDPATGQPARSGSFSATR